MRDARGCGQQGNVGLQPHALTVPGQGGLHVESQAQCLPQALGLRARQPARRALLPSCTLGPSRISGTRRSCPELRATVHSPRSGTPHPVGDRHSQSWVGVSCFHPPTDGKGSQRNPVISCHLPAPNSGNSPLWPNSKPREVCHCSARPTGLQPHTQPCSVGRPRGGPAPQP